jgi:MAC/Perforin domain/Hemopexin
MPTRTSPLQTLPGLEVVGRGVYLRPNQPYELKDVLFDRHNAVPYHSNETGLTYDVPEGYQVDNSPPMPATRALNQTIIEESWDRFQKQTSLDTSLAVGIAPFSVDINAAQTMQLRQEEDSYYAMRTSFVPLWALYLPSTIGSSDNSYDVQVPTPFSHNHRLSYARFFERYGTHYIRRAWVGGKATIALTISKSSQMTKDDIQAGIKASLPGLGGANVGIDDQRRRERLQNNSQCTVFGAGGDELKLASLSTLDDMRYNEWLKSVHSNPQVIELEVVGIWTLLTDKDRSEALMEAYKEETVSPPLRVVYNLDNRLHLFEDVYYYVYDMDEGETSKPRRIRDVWPELFRVGFERVDAAFLGKYLLSADQKDLSRKLFLFNRDKYVRWDVDSHTLDPGYPQLTSDDWPGVSFDRIDAVVNVAPDAIYFFCGNRYIRYNSLTHRADAGYPDLVSRRWAGVTFDRIDAATYWGNAKVYFFSGNQYIRYDTVMCRADPGYPKSIVSHYVEDWKFVE